VILRALKVFVKKFFYIFGLEIIEAPRRGTLIGALQQIKRFGFAPAMVIDVGAAIGEFTLRCHSIFPDSRYLLVEPLGENREYLEKVTKTIVNAEYVLAVATAEPGEVTLNVHSDLVGSSLYFEKEVNLDGVPRDVPAVILDDLCKDHAGPYKKDKS
jgi:FkbM family methyltransferase